MGLRVKNCMLERCIITSFIICSSLKTQIDDNIKIDLKLILWWDMI